MANVLEKVLPQDSQFTLTWSLQKMICHNCHNPFPVGLRPDARKCFFESGYILCFKISKKIFRNFFRKMLNPGFFFPNFSISIFRVFTFAVSTQLSLLPIFMYYYFFIIKIFTDEGFGKIHPIFSIWFLDRISSNTNIIGNGSLLAFQRIGRFGDQTKRNYRFYEYFNLWQRRCLDVGRSFAIFSLALCSNANFTSKNYY